MSARSTASKTSKLSAANEAKVPLLKSERGAAAPEQAGASPPEDDPPLEDDSPQPGRDSIPPEDDPPLEDDGLPLEDDGLPLEDDGLPLEDDGSPPEDDPPLEDDGPALDDDEPVGNDGPVPEAQQEDTPSESSDGTCDTLAADAGEGGPGVQPTSPPVPPPQSAPTRAQPAPLEPEDTARACPTLRDERLRRSTRALDDARLKLHGVAVYEALARLHQQLLAPGAAKRRTPFLIFPPGAAVHLLPVACVVGGSPAEVAEAGMSEMAMADRAAVSEGALGDLSVAVAEMQKQQQRSKRTLPGKIVWEVSQPGGNASTPVDVFVVPPAAASPAPGDGRVQGGPPAEDEARVLDCVRHSGDQPGRDPLRVVAVSSTLMRDRRAFHAMAKACDKMQVPPIFAVFQGDAEMSEDIEREIAELRPAWPYFPALSLALQVCAASARLASDYAASARPAGEHDAPRGQSTTVQACTRLVVLLQSTAPPFDTHFLDSVSPASCGAEGVLVVANSSADRALTRACAQFKAWRSSAAGRPGGERSFAEWDSGAARPKHLSLFPSYVRVVDSPAPEALQPALLDLYVHERRDVAVFAPSASDRGAWAASSPRAGLPASKDSPDIEANAFMQAVVDFVWTAKSGLPGADQDEGEERRQLRFSGVHARLWRLLHGARRKLSSLRHGPLQLGKRPLAYTSMDVSNAVLSRQNPRFFLCTAPGADTDAQDSWLPLLQAASARADGSGSTELSPESPSLFRDRVTEHLLRLMSSALACAAEFSGPLSAGAD